MEYSANINIPYYYAASTRTLLTALDDSAGGCAGVLPAVRGAGDAEPGGSESTGVLAKRWGAGESQAELFKHTNSPVYVNFDRVLHLSPPVNQVRLLGSGQYLCSPLFSLGSS